MSGNVLPIIMTGPMKCLAGALVTLMILIVPTSASVVCNCSGVDPGGGTVSSPCNGQTSWSDCLRSHTFYGNVTINGQPAPPNTNISVTGEGVCDNTTQNPIVLPTHCSYGFSGDAVHQLVVEGCIENGTPLNFSVDGQGAEVYDITTSGPWQPSYPFQAGEVTNLDIRVIPSNPPPDSVSIHTLEATVSNATLGFFQSIVVDKNPWMELRLAGGLFNVEISATGYHDFSGFPLLGRNATLGIYENGSPVAPEVNVAFGSRTARYAYVANKTRTFDICISVNDQPEIRDVKQLTVYYGRDENTSSSSRAWQGIAIPGYGSGDTIALLETFTMEPR
jgi:hypothetical protein